MFTKRALFSTQKMLYYAKILKKNQLHSEKLAQRGTETSKTLMSFKIHVPLLLHTTSLGFMSHAIAKKKKTYWYLCEALGCHRGMY